MFPVVVARKKIDLSAVMGPMRLVTRIHSQLRRAEINIRYLPDRQDSCSLNLYLAHYLGVPGIFYVVDPGLRLLHQ